jgi:hypothetical protein
MEHYWKRFIRLFEPSVAEANTAYRSGLQAQDFTDTSSINSVPLYELNEAKAFVLDARFSQRTAVATLHIIRGYAPAPGGTSFIPLGHEIYAFTAHGSAQGFAGKYSAGEVAFSRYGANAVKITLATSCSTGTVDLVVRSYW